MATAFYFALAECGNVYKIGIGIADITGPAAEINMMGYAQLSQRTSGIHLRQFSRAFVVDDGESRILFISIDAGMTSQLIYLEVTKALKEKYGALYTEKNVCISSTHTHSGPGGFLQYALYIVTSQGFIRQSYQSIVDGILKSVEMAHQNIQPGYIFWNEGDLYNASINRSPTSYLNNPPEERANYTANVDTKMFLLKFTDLNRKPIGMINWFAVHCTSMNNTNYLISSDNKGYASVLFEQKMNGKSLIGKGPFVAAFAQANEGDVSPNTRGPRCIDTGLPCDANTSTCNGQNEKCIAFGPGKDMFESTKIIGQRQYQKAVELFESATEMISGPIGYSHQYVDMSSQTVKINETTNATTCKPAMGYSFGAGTTDGPGGFDFKQGTKSDSLFWNLVRDLISAPSEELKSCQKPKPVLLPTGEMKFPYAWQPFIVPTQILRIGQLAVVAVPAEFTTMSGRRTRNAVQKILDKCSKTENKVVIAGLSNTYSSYVTTYEEYQVQRYEGASTIYGQHTLQAYIQQYERLAEALCKGEKLPDGPIPENMLDKQISLQPGVIFDSAYFGKSFGDVTKDAKDSYNPGNAVSVSFVSGHPRNNLMLEGTFMTVERFDPANGNWTIVATDADWETKFQWKRTNMVLGHSEATANWEIPEDAQPGRYRIQHFGQGVTTSAAAIGVPKSVISRLKKDAEGGNALKKHAGGRGRNTTTLEDSYVSLMAKRNRNLTPGQTAANLATASRTHVSA
ncbi:Neutral ceramidase like protein [Argiope bruennichi]|uniref:Neutral ceramidase n=1 Tax=Argiope bruennichi TaxID=94029 RepID=A0A8T0EXN9_ARGBR|nr:Neutral ceramidase like protein [Argiope bruennichi]